MGGGPRRPLLPLYSAGQAISQFAWIIQIGVQDSLFVMLLMLVLTIVLRRRWLATAALFLIAMGLADISPGSPMVLIVQGH